MLITIVAHTMLRIRSQVKLDERRRAELARARLSFYLFSSRLDYETAQKALTSSGMLSRTLESQEALGTTGGHAIGSGSDGDQGQQTELPSSLAYTPHVETISVSFPSLKAQTIKKLSTAESAEKRSEALKLLYRNLLVSLHFQVMWPLLYADFTLLLCA